MDPIAATIKIYNIVSFRQSRISWKREGSFF